ncbi:MAG: hypothetical protein ACLGHO_13945 [Gammaproteobacteria bacterium]
MSGELIFFVMMGLAFSLFPYSLCLLIMHFLMPQAVLDRYWKEPHFRPFELMLFSGWSFFAPMRTIMFMWAFMFPHVGKRRGIFEPHRLVPRWYRVASIVMNVWAIVMFGGVVSILLSFYIYFLVTGIPMTSWNWYDHLLLATAVGCFVFVFIRQWWINRRDEKAKRERPSRRKRDESA